MEILIETIIYLLAIFGIILVFTSSYEMIRYTNILKNTYSLFNRKAKRVEIIVRVYDLDEEEKNNLIEKIKNGDYEKIEEIVDDVKIEEVFDNK
ncbi:hypothetical protein D3C73_963820 [compost metagenome]